MKVLLQSWEEKCRLGKVFVIPGLPEESPYRVPDGSCQPFPTFGKFLELIPQRAGSRPHDNYCPRQTVKVNMTLPSLGNTFSSVQSPVVNSLHKSPCSVRFLPVSCSCCLGHTRRLPSVTGWAWGTWEPLPGSLGLTISLLC